MNLQDVANLTIPEGEVKMIHDKNRKLLWGRLSYDTKYKGNTTQITYTGRNLFNPALLSQVEGYNTYNSTTGLWTTTDLGAYYRSIFYDAAGASGNRDVSKIVGPLTANTTYTVEFYNFIDNSGSSSNPLAYSLHHSDGTIIGSSTRVNNFFTFTTPNESCYLDIKRLNNTGTFSFSKIMIVKGEYTEETFPSYEPYVGGVPSPNPDYPQDINVVTGEQTVMVYDKNLFNTSSYTVDNNQLTITRNADGSFTVNGTSTSITTIYFNNTIVLNGDYTLAQIGDKTTEQGYVNLYKNSDYTTTIAYFNTASNNHYKNFTTSQVSLSQRLSIPSGTYNNFVFRLMLVKGTYNLTTIGDYKLSQSQSYPISLGSTELCKIGTYQDYLYKSGDDWYVHKACGKVVLDGSSDEEWTVTNSGQANFFYRYRFINYDTSSPLGVSNNFVYANIVNATTNPGFMLINNNQVRFRPNFAELSEADWRTWLSTHNTTVYYPLATPTDTKITDNTLIGQLNAVHQFLTRYGYDFDISGNLPIIINQRGLN